MKLTMMIKRSVSLCILLFTFVMVNAQTADLSGAFNEVLDEQAASQRSSFLQITSTGSQYAATFFTASPDGTDEQQLPVTNLSIDQQDNKIRFRLEGKDYEGEIVEQSDGALWLMLWSAGEERSFLRF